MIHAALDVNRDGRVDFKIRYDKLPANFYLTNIYLLILSL